MSALQEARDLLTYLKQQDRQQIYAVRTGICAGMAQRGEVRQMFRLVDGKIRFEKIGDGRKNSSFRDYFWLPDGLAKEVQEFLDSL